MLTDTVRGPTGAGRFVLRGVAGSLAFFGLLRLNWIEAQVVLPFTRMQAGVAAGLFGAPASPVEATLACSGADALALCLGAVLAYPVTWRARLAGAAGGIALIVGLNTVRIGTLGRAAASPAWFNALHLYVWPAVLTLAIAGYVFCVDARRGSATLRQVAVGYGAAGSAFGYGASAATIAAVRRAHDRLSCSCFPPPRPSTSRAPACSPWPASSPARPRRSSASPASTRTPPPMCSGRRAAASSSRRSALPRR